MKNNKILISIVSPAYNEEQNILPMAQAVQQAMQTLDTAYTYEYIIVDDGSQDQTWQKIGEVAQKNPKIKGIRLTRNFGQQKAISAGIDRASGEALIYLDSDLQHPPQLFSNLIREWEQGVKVVHTRRTQTANEPLIKKAMSKIFYKVAGFLFEIPIEAGMSDFKLLDKEVYEKLKLMRERNRFLRGMVPWLGYPSATVAYEASRRAVGSPYYNFRRNLSFAKIGILSMSTKPLKYVGYLGAALTILSFFGLAGSFAVMIYKNDLRYISPAVILALFNAFLIGIVLACLGVVAVYISYLHQEIVERPLYVVREKVNFG